MKKRGFTLIELLAVIIILAILMIIAVPNILNTLNKSKEEIRIQNVNGLVEATEMYVYESMMNTELKTDGNILEEVLEESTNGKEPESGDIRYDKEKGIAVAAVYDGECYIKNFSDSTAKKVLNQEKCRIELNDTLYTLEDGSVSSCFTYEKYLKSYDIDYDTCMVVIKQVYPSTTSDAADSLCKGEEVDSTSIDREARYGVGIDTLKSYGVVNNIVYDGVLITDYNCVIDNDKGYPEISSVVIPTKINDEYVRGVDGFQSKKLSSVDLTWLYELEYFGREVFAYNYELSGVVDLSNSDKLTKITHSFGIFFETKINEVILPKELKNINGFFDNEITNITYPINLEIIEELAFAMNKLSGTLDLSELLKLKSIKKYAYRDNLIAELILPKNIETIEENSFLKTETSNPGLIKIVNPTGRSFDWSSITGSDTLNQNFVTGTIIHQNGNIEVVAS